MGAESGGARLALPNELVRLHVGGLLLYTDSRHQDEALYLLTVSQGVVPSN